MNSLVSMREFAPAVLPFGAANTGILRMLAAYFDDSGTHPNSDIVLMAGVFGFPNQWDFFSELWAKKLANPCPGKLPLSRFHMAHCQSIDGEFEGWKRHETDFLIHELGSIILQTGIYGFGGAIPRKAYDSLITGDMRRASGDAETMCLINCFTKMVAFAKEFAPGHEIAILFDTRPQKKQDIQTIYDIYKRSEETANVVSVGFGDSKKILPLQAADLFAWEIYQDSLDSLAGRTEAEGPRRDQLKRLIAGGRVRVEFCSPERVAEMAKHPISPEALAEIAAHAGFK